MYCWIVFIHIVQNCPGGLLQFSKGEAVKIFLASVSSVHSRNEAEQGETPIKIIISKSDSKILNTNEQAFIKMKTSLPRMSAWVTSFVSRSSSRQ